MRLEHLFSGASSYLKIASTTASGGNPGTAGWTNGWTFGAGPGAPANVEIAEIVIVGADPSAAAKAQFDAYVTARYGAGLV